ncbi:hypothetical protein BJX62DRAFT_69410 [Aspergillus germanicus]
MGWEIQGTEFWPESEEIQYQLRIQITFLALNFSFGLFLLPHLFCIFILIFLRETKRKEESFFFSSHSPSSFSLFFSPSQVVVSLPSSPSRSRWYSGTLPFATLFFWSSPWAHVFSASFSLSRPHPRNSPDAHPLFFYYFLHLLFASIRREVSRSCDPGLLSAPPVVSRIGR